MNNITLEEFLIENTNINKKFIRDFFGLQNEEKYKSHKPFVIDLEIVSKWLKARKDNLKETLTKTYIKNFDYVVLRLLDDQEIFKGHKNKEFILLTTDCFKKLCMLSKAKNAEKVRDYYLELEKLVDKYKDYLIEHMNKELDNKNKQIDILKNDLKNDKLPNGDYIYVFEDVDELGILYYRIGLSSDLNKRFKNHNSSSIHKKKIILKIKSSNIKHLEKCLLGILYDYRYKNDKDYFKVSIDKIKKAVKICEECIIKFKCYSFFF